jgi:hypothetical protein
LFPFSDNQNSRSLVRPILDLGARSSARNVPPKL